MADPQYYYSRKMCLDASLTICSPASELRPGEEDDWTRMAHTCVGFFKSSFFYAMTTVFFELSSAIQEHRADPALSAPTVSKTSPSSPQSFMMPTQCQTLRAVLDSAQEMAIARVRKGETNVKGAAFFMCALARLDALVAGEDPEAAVLEAAKRAVTEMSQIMKQAYREEHGEDIDLGPSSDALAREKRKRGDGANHVAGAGTSAASYNTSNLYDGSTASKQGMDGPGRLDGGLEAWCMGTDTELNNSLPDANIEFKPGMYFARSPEWFFDLNGWAASEDLGAGFPGRLF